MPTSLQRSGTPQQIVECAVHELLRWPPVLRMAGVPAGVAVRQPGGRL